MCSAYIPFQDPNKPRIRLFAISRSGRLIQLYPEEDLRIHGVPGQYSVEAGMICNDATNYCHSFFSVSKLSGIVISEEEVDQIRQALQRQYVCTFSNKWETLSVTFNLTLLSSPSGIATQLYCQLYTKSDKIRYVTSPSLNWQLFSIESREVCELFIRYLCFDLSLNNTTVMTGALKDIYPTYHTVIY